MPQALLVKALVSQLRVTLEAIGSFDQAIAERAQHHPDFALFEALPGAGAALAPRLLVAFGEQRERYGSAAEVQTSAGIAPVMERSGPGSRGSDRERGFFAQADLQPISLWWNPL